VTPELAHPALLSRRNLIHLKVLAAVARHGSVTEAARELHYSQPSVSHYLSHLEAATGVKLIQRVGRGIRLTPEGQLLATRSAEIVGRVEAATSELAAQVGLRAGRVRLAANASSLSTIVPKAVTALTRAHPGLELILLDRHPVEALQLLRQGKIDVALVYRYTGAPVEEEEEGFRLVHVGDDSIRLVSRRPEDSIASHLHSAWIGGCDRCQNELITLCRHAGFTPRIASHRSVTTWSSCRPSSPPAWASPPCPVSRCGPTAIPACTPPSSPASPAASTPPPTAIHPIHPPPAR
jgi:DNA-binding transcriptional LysR family regulator